MRVSGALPVESRNQSFLTHIYHHFDFASSVACWVSEWILHNLLLLAIEFSLSSTFFINQATMDWPIIYFTEMLIMQSPLTNNMINKIVEFTTYENK